MSSVSLIDGHIDPEPIELKPCPFCGSEAALLKDLERDVVGVFCKDCGCGTPYFHSLNLKHAIDRWNMRAYEPERGHWINDLYCSVCGYIYDTGEYSNRRNYCPNCGAEMNEKEK